MPTLTATRPAALPSAGSKGLIRRVFDTLMLWQQRAAERDQLMAMDDRMLQDLGVSRVDVDFEYAKPFWRS
jgi:uncharacterized protein YjiS (DUF1127 family)